MKWLKEYNYKCPVGSGTAIPLASPSSGSSSSGSSSSSSSSSSSTSNTASTSSQTTTDDAPTVQYIQPNQNQGYSYGYR